MLIVKNRNLTADDIISVNSEIRMQINDKYDNIKNLCENTTNKIISLTKKIDDLSVKLNKIDKDLFVIKNDISFKKILILVVSTTVTVALTYIGLKFK